MAPITPSTRKTSYNPVTPTTAFPVNFPIADNSDLKVTVNGATRTDFTVASTYPDGLSYDAVVNMNTAVTGAVIIYGKRIPRRQNQFQTGRPLSIPDLNASLNTLEIESQEARRDIDQNTSDIAQEIIDRGNAVAQVQANLNAETTARIAGDNSLNAALATEASIRAINDAALASLISQGGPIEVAVYDSTIAVQFANIKGTTNAIRTGGYFLAGDGGAALYKRVNAEPAHAGKIQSADGAWWELSSTRVTSAMFGARKNNLAFDSTQAFQDFLDFISGRIAGFVDAGQYLITKTLAIGDDTTIYGHGAELVASASLFPNYEPMDNAVGKGGITPNSKPIISNKDPSNGNSNIRIFGLKWTGNPTGPNHGLYMRAVTGLTIAYCVTFECLSPIAIVSSTDVKVLFNDVSGFRNGGIDTWGGCKRVKIIGNTVDGSGSPAPDGSNIGIFCTSEPTDPTDPGTFQAEDYIIADNTVHDTQNTGIWVGGGTASANRINDIAKNISVSGNNLYAIGDIGIIVERSEDVSVDNNRLRGINHHGIFTRKNVSSGAAAVTRPSITNNKMLNVGVTVADSKFIHMDDTTVDAHVAGNVGKGTTHSYAMYDRGTNSGLTYYGNQFQAGTSGTYDILSTSGVNGNPNNRVLTGSVVWDAPSIANGAQATTTLNIPGAALGDKVSASSTGVLSGLRLWGEVTAANTVTLALSNTTGAAVDPSSKTYYVDVEKLRVLTHVA